VRNETEQQRKKDFDHHPLPHYLRLSDFGGGGFQTFSDFGVFRR